MEAFLNQNAAPENSSAAAQTNVRSLGINVPVSMEDKVRESFMLDGKKTTQSLINKMTDPDEKAAAQAALKKVVKEWNDNGKTAEGKKQNALLEQRYQFGVQNGFDNPYEANIVKMERFEGTERELIIGDLPVRNRSSNIKIVAGNFKPKTETYKSFPSHVRGGVDQKHRTDVGTVAYGPNTNFRVDNAVIQERGGNMGTYITITP